MYLINSFQDVIYKVKPVAKERKLEKQKSIKYSLN